MRRLLLLPLVLALAGGLPPPQTAGQTPAGAEARAAVRTYLETMPLVVSTVRVDRSRPPQTLCPIDPAGVNYLPAELREPIAEARASTALQNLYQTTLSAHTRGRIAYDQLFSAYLDVARKEREFLRTVLDHPGREFCVQMRFDVREPALNERGDVALVPARVAADYIALNSASQTPFPLDWEWLASMVAGPSAHTLQHHVTSGGRAIALMLIAVREGHQWRVVLPDAAVREIQQIVVTKLQIWPTLQIQRPGPRYAPHASVADLGVTLTVLDVTLEQEETILRLALANNNQDTVIVADTLRRATLADEAGKESRVRPPREALPDRLSGLSAVGLTLAFDPIPAASKTATLVLPDLRVGDRTVTLKLTFAMRSAAYPVVGETGIPVEPLLLYLMSVLRPAVMDVEREGPLRQFYQQHLAPHTRGQITEADFITYWTTRARTQRQRVFGEGAQVYDLDFVIGLPAYSASRDQAVVTATITTRGGYVLSFMTRVDEISFRVIRDGPSWRLELPDRVVEEIQPPPPPGVQRRWFPNARGTEAGIGVWVRQVALMKDVTLLDVTIENGQAAEAGLFEAMAEATLTDEHSNVFHTRMLRTTVPDRMAGRTSATAVIAFEPIPMESTRLVLTLPRISVADQNVTISLPIVLVRP